MVSEDAHKQIAAEAILWTTQTFKDTHFLVIILWWVSFLPVEVTFAEGLSDIWGHWAIAGVDQEDHVNIISFTTW